MCPALLVPGPLPLRQLECPGICSSETFLSVVVSTEHLSESPFRKGVRLSRLSCSFPPRWEETVSWLHFFNYWPRSLVSSQSRAWSLPAELPFPVVLCVFSRCLCTCDKHRACCFKGCGCLCVYQRQVGTIFSKMLAFFAVLFWLWEVGHFLLLGKICRRPGERTTVPKSEQGGRKEAHGSHSDTRSFIHQTQVGFLLCSVWFCSETPGRAKGKPSSQERHLPVQGTASPSTSGSSGQCLHKPWTQS